MRPKGRDGDFERQLERELRLYVASAPRPGPRLGQPAYRAGSRRGWQSSLTSGILGKAVAGVMAAVLTVGAGSAVAMAATGSHNPGELAESIAQRVEGCKDKVATDNHDRSTGAEVAASTAGNSRGTGKCVGSEVNQNQNSDARQQKNGVTDPVERKAAHPSTSPGTHQDHGQGSGAGSVGAPGQGGTGRGTGDGGPGDNGDSDNHGDSSNHGHQATPSPTPSSRS
jgi:hypothetical protein